MVAATGSGWLVPSAVDSFEHITGGDSAIVAVQYSHLPSWISYLVDQEQAREAGHPLFDAVYERWSQLPAGGRPDLVVFWESLGVFGGETAFSGEHDLANRTDGALFVGPPSFNALYREIADGREQGSTEIEPVYRDGRIVRFTNDVATEIPPDGAAWNGTRVLYLQHPSDPIVWWSTDPLIRRPDWLEDARGRDVLDEMVWIPFVAFWQITADLPMGLGVPAGHGHNTPATMSTAGPPCCRPDGWNATDAA